MHDMYIVLMHWLWKFAKTETRIYIWVKIAISAFEKIMSYCMQNMHFDQKFPLKNNLFNFKLLSHLTIKYSNVQS